VPNRSLEDILNDNGVQLVEPDTEARSLQFSLLEEQEFFEILEQIPFEVESSFAVSVNRDHIYEIPFYNGSTCFVGSEKAGSFTFQPRPQQELRFGVGGHFDDVTIRLTQSVDEGQIIRVQGLVQSHTELVLLVDGAFDSPAHLFQALRRNHRIVTRIQTVTSLDDHQRFGYMVCVPR